MASNLTDTFQCYYETSFRCSRVRNMSFNNLAETVLYYGAHYVTLKPTINFVYGKLQKAETPKLLKHLWPILILHLFRYRPVHHIYTISTHVTWKKSAYMYNQSLSVVALSSTFSAWRHNLLLKIKLVLSTTMNYQAHWQKTAGIR